MTWVRFSKTNIIILYIFQNNSQYVIFIQLNIFFCAHFQFEVLFVASL